MTTTLTIMTRIAIRTDSNNDGNNNDDDNTDNFEDSKYNDELMMKR